MPVALVTGDAAETGAVAAGFERRGFAVQTAAPWGSGHLPAGGIDCYVQLPVGTGAAGPVLGRGGLVGRLDLLALMARRLSPLATVLLAVDRTDPFEPGSPDDMLAALALVVLEEAGRDQVKVVVLNVCDIVSSTTIDLTSTETVLAAAAAVPA